MNYLTGLLFLAFLMSCGKGAKVPLIQTSGGQFIQSEQYEQYIIDRFDDVYSRMETNKDQPLYLHHKTFGFSLDFKVGWFRWQKGVNSAIEFHMKPDTDAGSI